MRVHQVPAILQVFVAGATGNTGKRVVQQLSSKGIKVLAGTRVNLWPATHPLANCSDAPCTYELPSAHARMPFQQQMHALSYRAAGLLVCPCTPLTC